MIPKRSEIYSLVSAWLSDFAQSASIPLAEDTVLVGDTGLLDSMGLLTFLLDVEQRIEERFGASVVLVTEDALAREPNPFTTVGSLADHVAACLQAESGG